MNDEAELYALVFGKVLARLRERARLSQDQLAKRAGLTQGTLSRIEAGRLKVDLITTRLLAQRLGLTQEQLLRFVEDALAQTQEYARRVVAKKPSASWLDDLTAVAGAVAIAAVVTLAVEALLHSQHQKVAAGAKRPTKAPVR